MGAAQATMQRRATAQPPPVSYAFTIAGRGPRQAHAWPGDAVALLVEAQDDGGPTLSAPGYARAALMRAFDAVYNAYVYIAGRAPDRQEVPFRGRTVIQVPLDNAGAGGLAHHGVAGISVGVGLVRPLVERWARVSQGDLSWLPAGEGPGLDGLRFGQHTPRDASVDQVFFYELARNFWRPWFNKKIDWACNGDPNCWGWWTVGMCNAMAVIIPALIGVPMNYFGSDREHFRDRMVAELQAYITYSQTRNNPFEAWTLSLMPWKPKESVNDLMSGFLIRSFERFGGETWIRGFFREIANVPDVNPTPAGRTDFQHCRDNLYRIWSRAAGANLYFVFAVELLWPLSPSVQEEISTQFPSSNSLSLGLAPT